jgi:AmmeMemoRadiSam system protein A
MENIMDQITEEHGEMLVELARRVIAARLKQAEIPGGLESSLAACLDEPCLQNERGTFVTLKIKGQLRGCMGCLTASESIVEGIRRNALNAAFDDPRFPALTAEELARAEIEVSILTEPQELHYSDSNDLITKLRPNIDGLIIKKGMARSTFLPQVWAQLPRTEDFLTHLCLKAGLPGNEWQSGELEVSTYQVQYFHEKS